MALLSSPLARAVETAAPLLLRWPQPLRIDVRVAEIPTDTSAAMGGALSTRGEAAVGDGNAAKSSVMMAIG